MKRRSLFTLILIIVMIGIFGIGAVTVATWVHRTNEAQQERGQEILASGVVFYENAWYTVNTDGVLLEPQVSEDIVNATTLQIRFSPEPDGLPVGTVFQLLSPLALQTMNTLASSLPQVGFTMQGITLDALESLWFTITTTQGIALLVDWRIPPDETMKNLKAVLTSQRYNEGGVATIDLRFGKKVFIK